MSLSELPGGHLMWEIGTNLDRRLQNRSPISNRLHPAYLS